MLIICSMLVTAVVAQNFEKQKSDLQIAIDEGIPLLDLSEYSSDINFTTAENRTSDKDRIFDMMLNAIDNFDSLAVTVRSS